MIGRSAILASLRFSFGRFSIRFFSPALKWFKWNVCAPPRCRALASWTMSPPVSWSIIFSSAFSSAYEVNAFHCKTFTASIEWRPAAWPYFHTHTHPYTHNLSPAHTMCTTYCRLACISKSATVSKCLQELFRLQIELPVICEGFSAASKLLRETDGSPSLADERTSWLVTESHFLANESSFSDPNPKLRNAQNRPELY